MAVQLSSARWVGILAFLTTDRAKGLRIRIVPGLSGEALCVLPGLSFLQPTSRSQNARRTRHLSALSSAAL